VTSSSFSGTTLSMYLSPSPSFRRYESSAIRVAACPPPRVERGP
jgi:hypothetical protein